MTASSLDDLQAKVAELEERCQAAERARQAAETRYRQLADSAPPLIWMAGVDKSCHYFNARWLEFRGRRLDEELHDGWLEGVHPADLENVLQQFQAAFDSRQSFSIEFRFRRHDGEYCWVVDSGRPCYDSQGEFEGYVGSCVDITDYRKASEQAYLLNRELTRQVEDFQTLVDTLPLPVTVAQDRNCSEVWINVALAEMLQLPPDANASLTSPGAQDFTFKFCRNGEELSLEELPMRKAMALGRELRDIEFDLVRKDGVTINMFGHAIPLKNEQGEVRGCIAAWADITARKLAEESLKSADRRKDQFLAMLAHELRNPLAPLRTGLELLQLGGIDPAESAEVLAMMHGQLMHIIRLVDDVLEVSRITRGRIELRTERLELRSVLQTALETTHELLTELGHTLTVELPPEPVYLEADPVRLTQIIANLLQNAAKYTERSGKLELIVSNPPPIDPHSVLDSEKTHFVEISVRDNGLGIAPEMLPHVFDLFEQAGASHSHARGGLGIGLMLTSKLVQLHGGSIRAESAGKGCGSTFTVLLPAAAAPENPPADLLPATSSAPARGTGTRRILVVDDNRDAADCLGKILALLHHDVRVAHDGFDALEQIPRFHPELVLMDLGMPGLDGIETARRILAESSGSPPVLVALSGWGQEEDRRKTREAGFAAHLLKPVELSVLQATIAGLLG